MFEALIDQLNFSLNGLFVTRPKLSIHCKNWASVFNLRTVVSVWFVPNYYCAACNLLEPNCSVTNLDMQTRVSLRMSEKKKSYNVARFLYFFFFFFELSTTS